VGSFLIPVFAVAIGCTVQRSDLITSIDGGVTPLDVDVVVEPLAADVIAAIDERPVGGASLTTGTVGGGDYQAAFAEHRIYLVRDIETLKKRVSGDDAAIILIAEGDYTSTADPTKQQSCSQTCEPTTPVAAQTVTASYCAEDASLSETTYNFDRLKIGANKTVIGLGKGAKFTNIEFVVSWSKSVILRNLSIADVSPTFIDVGYGLRIEPADHIWIDHVTFRNIGHSFVLLSSDNDKTTGEVATEAGFITFSNNHFDGWVEGACGQRCRSVIGSQRNPALTFVRNWFQRSSSNNPYLFGPGTWGHLFNNLWSDIDDRGVLLGCGALGVLQGNVFDSTKTAVLDNDAGYGTWSFCSKGLYGVLYAPTETSSDEDNRYDSASALVLNDQPTDGTGLTVPVRVKGSQWSVEVPIGSDKTETYRYELLPTPDEVEAHVQANAGVGKLFLSE
jgi:pectate lyase